LTVSGVVIAGDYSQTNNCPVAPNTLAVGARCTFHVIFKPKMAGVRKGHLTVTDNASPNPQTVDLTGVGVTR
jgi:hypothetical protein